VDPAAIGFDRERLVRIERHLEQRYLAPGKIPGAITVVARREGPAWVSVLGKMDLERDRPMREDTIFRIYSMTKPVTSVALMMLYEEAAFRLDDPVQRFLPEWRSPRVFRAGEHPRFLTEPAARRITVRDLLTHTAGLTYGFMQRTNVDAAYRKLGIGTGGATFPGTLAEMVELLGRLPLEFSPGTAWNYSVATDVLGHLVERISGTTLDVFFRERITGPLGMVDTDFHVPPEKADRLAACYERGPAKELRLQDDPRTSRYLEPPVFLSGGGGLVSTAADLLRFYRMLLRGGELDGVRILSRKTLELMARNHLPGGADMASLSVAPFGEVGFEGTGFGLGFAVTLDPVRAGVVGSPGELAWGGAASTLFSVDPAEDLLWIFLTQLMPSRTFDFRSQIKALVYGALAD